jgi:peptidyl-prolyl cis-trans isomerase C
MPNFSLPEAPERERAQQRPPEYRYHLLRAALGAGLPGLPALDERQLTRVSRQAAKSFDLESLVLGSQEAATVVVSDQRLDQAVQELRGRYPDETAFIADLAGNGLDEETLRGALHRELIFDAALQRVASRRPAVSEIHERLFYALHKDRFTQPERRTARHILIRINDEFAESWRHAARGRIDVLAEELARQPHRFPSLARQHSECPSAMDGGRLGTVPRGRLYAELDAVLFSLSEGAVSVPVESEMGFHLLRCEKIHSGRTLPFSEVQPQIHKILEESAKRNCQKSWIDELRRVSSAGRAVSSRQTP